MEKGVKDEQHTRQGGWNHIEWIDRQYEAMRRTSDSFECPSLCSSRVFRFSVKIGTILGTDAPPKPGRPENTGFFSPKASSWWRWPNRSVYLMLRLHVNAKARDSISESDAPDRRAKPLRTKRTFWNIEINRVAKSTFILPAQSSYYTIFTPILHWSLWWNIELHERQTHKKPETIGNYGIIGNYEDLWNLPGVFRRLIS